VRGCRFNASPHRARPLEVVFRSILSVHLYQCTNLSEETCCPTLEEEKGTGEKRSSVMSNIMKPPPESSAPPSPNYAPLPGYSQPLRKSRRWVWKERQVKAMETRQHTSFRAFIKQHAVLTFYILVFALSWGILIIAVGPGAFLSTGVKLTSPADLGPFVFLANLAGPLISPALPAILVIALAYGRVGLRDLRSRLFRWRVSVRWYAVALLTAPLLMTAILFALSLTSKAFLPALIPAGDKTSLPVSGLVVVMGLVVGLVEAYFEELGFTGFATPEVRKRHGLLATGLIVGLPWAAFQLPYFVGTASSSGPVPPALYVAVILFSWLPAYRVLMVWVYDHTQSVLVGWLMRLPSILVCWFILFSPALVGVPGLIFDLVFGATLWVLVAAVAVANRRKLSRGEHTRATSLTHAV
jgi:hypothetical protein